MSQFIKIEITAGSESEANRIAECLVEQRLAACVQISGPVKSVYRWEGKIESDSEYLCSIKTRHSLFNQVSEVIVQLHSYDTPQIIASPIVAGSDGYLQWLAAETLDPDQQN